MNTKIKKKWITALTNGSYTQGHFQLKDGNTYCCLGVLCDLYVKETKLAQWEGGKCVHPHTMDIFFPNYTVLEWAGIDVSDVKMLAAHNDMVSGEVRSHSFAEIAELIENYL